MAKATKRADGRLVKKVIDPATGKPRYFYGNTIREINEKIMEYTSEEDAGRQFEYVANEWWDTNSDNFKLQTLKPYRPAFRRAVETFGEHPIKKILPRDVSAYFSKLAKEGKAQKTVSNYKTVLNGIFAHAIDHGYIDINPCASVSIPRGLPKTKRKSASIEDEDKVRSDEDAWLFNVIALYTGMRKGEILALQWKDVDMENDLIFVSKNVAHDGDKPVIDTPKTEAGTRVVPIVPALKERLLREENRDPERFIISDTGDKPLTNRRYITLSKRERARADLSCTAHNLRHSFATNAFEVGLDANSVKEVIGHKQISTTLDMYTDFRMQSVKKAAKILAANNFKDKEKNHH